MPAKRDPRLFEDADDEEVIDDPAKASGAYYTPEAVVQTLVRWVVRKATDRLIDPACGDGRFLAAHANSVGVEQDAAASATANQRNPGGLIHRGDFFLWASQTSERFDCAAGNPPFIRYQRFSGDVRDAALRLCRRHGANFSALTSSWAPFLVATATLLKAGGRMGFVVPAEIGHAPYAAPVIEYMTKRFDVVHIIAVRQKLFPELSEDCWLLRADGYGGSCDTVRFSAFDRFAHHPEPPTEFQTISLSEWRRWNFRLRPFLLPAAARAVYERAIADPRSRRLGDVARVGIGYVTGANDFFHLRPSDVDRYGIPRQYLHPAVRSGQSLGQAVTPARVREWLNSDEPVLLLRLTVNGGVSAAVESYLNSRAAHAARATYKCRNRDPWYVVPGVSVPDGFLSYMSGVRPRLVSNDARCVCTNSVHAVQLFPGMTFPRLQKVWGLPLTELSCEIEGHSLGGGMLKLEPREAAHVLLTPLNVDPGEARDVSEGTAIMRRWRHYGK